MDHYFKDSKEMLSIIYNNTTDIMFLTKVNENNQFIYCSVNMAFVELMRISKKMCLGKRFDEILPGERTKEFLYAFQMVLAKKQKMEFEFQINSDGQNRFIKCTLIPIFDESAGCSYILVVGQDISEWKKKEEELLKLKMQAEESNRLKSTLLSNMNHEVRTPLHGILGLAELMKEDLEFGEHKKMANEISKAGKRLLNTLHSIIELSTLEADKIDVNYTKVDLSEVVQLIFDKFRTDAESKGLYFHLEINCFDLRLHIDRTLFTEILNNLIDNALKFTNTGGIKVIVEKMIKDDNCYALIKIIDTGIGISSQSKEKIFDEFIQESNGFSRSHEGIGLGLTLVKKMTTIMGGEITVESEKHIGSVFSLKFPALSEYLNKESIVSVPSKTKYTNENLPLILMVEDNELNSKLTSTFLKNVCRVEIAQDALTALQKIKEAFYDAILMDINLGSGMNGVDALNEIRKVNYYKDIPIIAMTGYAFKNDKNNLLECGFTHYLSKPFEKIQLINLMNEVFISEIAR